MERHVLVIGAGQAGLAAGYHLRAAGVPFQIVDSHHRVGDNWRTRYDSLTLFTPRQFSALPGLELAGNRELYATRDEFADYLESYAARLRLPITLRRQVTRLSKSDGESFEAMLDDGRIIVTSEVIVATGAFQRAVVPEIADRFGDGVLQLTTETYRNPNQLPDGPVLVVGDGASGRDIAAEVRPLQPVLLAAGRSRKLFPERVLGKSIWWWLNLLGILKAPPQSRIGRMLKGSDAFPDRDRSTESLASRGIRILPRLTEASGRVAQFADATSADIRTVIWAVGYQDDTSWLDISEAKGPAGAFLHEAGISPVKGIYFVGRPWQRNRASALIMGAGSDAELIVQRLLSDSE